MEHTESKNSLDSKLQVNNNLLIITSNLSRENEHFCFRAKKFGIEAPEVINDKKKSRAERFGLVQASKEPANAEKDEMDAKKKSRAERFGLNINQKRVSVSFSKISRFLERTLIEHVHSIRSLDSNLFFHSICSIEIRSKI